MDSSFMIENPLLTLPTPPPPPPPPPPHDMSSYHNTSINSQLKIDLVPASIVKPNMKMRTLNWRRIPKKRVLAQELDKTPVNIGSGPREQQEKSSTTSDPNQTYDFETSYNESTNIWFLIAKENNSIKKIQPTTSNTQATSSSSSSSNTVSSSNRSASRIREMLESVRRRMAAVKINSEHSSFADLQSISGSKDNISEKRSKRNIIEAIDFDHLESLFCLNSQPSEHHHLDSESPKFIRRSSMRTNGSSDSMISNNSYYNDSSNNGDDDDDSLNEFEPILDSKKSLNANIFLKQLKSPDDLIDQINRDLRSDIGKDRLECVLRLIPDKVEENQLMKFYIRNKQNRLPVAEKFLLKLITEVPNLKLRVKFMLLQEEYSSDIEAISPELDKIERAAKEIMSSKMFRDILNLVLTTGNFLNTGGYAADAAGFSLDCLDRLSEVRSNKPGIYLIHYVADVASKLDLINFQRQELPDVEPASRVCIDSIKIDLNSMIDKIKELKQDTEAEGDSGGNESRLYLLHLLRTLDEVKGNVEFLKRRTTHNLEETRKQLALYLCEDPDTFKLHDCLHNILTFSQKLKTAVEENERRIKSELSRLDRSNCSLRRSNTINSKLLLKNGGRLSLGDSFSSQSTCYSSYLKTDTTSDTSKPSTHLIDNLNQSTSNLLLRTTSTYNLNDGSSPKEFDDLHDGLMKLLVDSNSRRASDIPNRSKISSFGTYRRTSKLFKSKGNM